MKIRPLDSTIRSTLPLLLGSLLASTACDDQRLRELGYTLNGLSSPGAGAEDPKPCVPDPIDADAVQRAIASDLAATPLESRPFLRYLSLADRIALGQCSDNLELGRDAASKLLNSLSREPSIVVPRAFGPEGGLLRIDLRDYGWTRSVEVKGRSFADGWDALLEQTGFALELTGDRASFIAEQTHSRAPLLSVTAFVNAAANAALYYPLLGLPPTLAELRQFVGLSSALDPVEDHATRTAAQYSRAVRRTGSVRVIDRYGIGAGSAGTYQEATMVDATAFFADPLHVQPAEQRLIRFSLPNDLAAFAIADAAGILQGVSEGVLDTNLESSKATVLVSCSNCHATGLILATDVARDAILAHPAQFNPEVVAAYQASLDDTQRSAQFVADSEPYLKALERSTGETEGSDPISSFWFSTDQQVDLGLAAAELLVDTDLLRSRLAELAPQLRPLGLGLGLSRAQFSAAYAGAYCALHAEDENPPAPAFCGQQL